MAVGFLVGSASEFLSDVTTGGPLVELGSGNGLEVGAGRLGGFTGGRLGLP